MDLHLYDREHQTEGALMLNAFAVGGSAIWGTVSNGDWPKLGFDGLPEGLTRLGNYLAELTMYYLALYMWRRTLWLILVSTRLWSHLTDCFPVKTFITYEQETIFYLQYALITVYCSLLC